MSRSVHVVSKADALARETVLVPVVVRDGAVVLDGALPSAIGTVELAPRLDESWCHRHGLTSQAGSSVVLRGFGPTTVVLVSVGSAEPEGYRVAAATGVRLAGEDAVGFLLAVDGVADARLVAQAVAEGAILGSFDYKDDAERPFDLAALASPLPTVAAHDAIVAGARDGSIVAESVNWARRLINTPAGDLPPRELASRVIERLDRHPRVAVEAWTESRIRAEGLGGLLGVGRGSAEPTRLVRATYDPEPGAALPHVALVGKGVTFDSGGLSLKPAASMIGQKTDMSGAAIVLGAISALHELGVRVRATAFAPMTENLTGDKATKPGDVLTIRNGRTVEVLNTDAEGRLILADALSLAAEVAPDVIIDIATLTGAQRVALGDEVAAVYASDDDLAAAVLASGARSGEQLWRMPLTDSYESQLDSDVADMKNIGKVGVAGSVVAALFLRRFTDGRPWVHFDIAGPGRSDAAGGYVNVGGTAFGLRTIVDYVTGLARD
ncbi:MAG: leucyl aminopeptidase family protein [Actinomycetales bacterium]|nr:leucyl aminopeptidase family protein [Actinomycetales bacterium]